LKSPTTTPVAIPTIIPIIAGRAYPSLPVDTMRPAFMPDNANIDPIERSMQFMMIKIPTPIVAIPIHETCLSIVIILLYVMKVGAAMDNKTTMIRNTIIIP